MSPSYSPETFTQSARSQPSTSGADGVGMCVSYTCVIQSAPYLGANSVAHMCRARVLFSLPIFRSWWCGHAYIIHVCYPVCPYSGAGGVGMRISYMCVIQSALYSGAGGVGTRISYTRVLCTCSFTFLLFHSWYLQLTFLPVRIRNLRSFLPACQHLCRTPGSHPYSGVQLFGCTNLDYEDELRFIRKIWNLYIVRKICF